jgi:hypothetical protein
MGLKRGLVPHRIAYPVAKDALPIASGSLAALGTHLCSTATTGALTRGCFTPLSQQEASAIALSHGKWGS